MPAKVEEFGHFIGGKWVVPPRAKRFETVNPSTREPVGSFVLGTPDDVNAAVAAAAKAFPAWRDTPAPVRGEILLEVARRMKEAKPSLGRTVTREMGKVISEGLGDVQESIDFIEYMAGEGRRLAGETIPSELRSKFCMTVRQPKGVVACITPWNFPTAIPNWKIAAALITGNTIVFKPATATARCGAEVVRLYEDAGLPPGVLNFVTGSGSVVGNALVADPRVRTVSFTGGVEAGRDVYVRGAQGLKMVHLELGGKNPVILMDDADLPLALDGVLFGAFGTAGQRCTATSRLILHAKVYDQFLEMLTDRLDQFPVGDPLDPKTGMGPVASADQEKKILEYIEIANGIEYGLSSALYTKDVNKAFTAMRDLYAGITYINAPTIGAEVHLPFGGTKATGNGHREGGIGAIDFYTEWKSVYVDFSDKLQKAQIDREE